LPGYEGKVISQLHEELFQFADEGLFEFSFGVFVLEPQEFERERIFDLASGEVVGDVLSVGTVNVSDLWYDSVELWRSSWRTDHPPRIA